MVFPCEVSSEVGRDHRESSRAAKPSAGVMGASGLPLHFGLPPFSFSNTGRREGFAQQW